MSDSGGEPPRWTTARIVLTVLGIPLLGFGLLVAGYGIVVTIGQPLLFIVGIPFAIFGLILAFAGLLLIGGPALRARLRRRRA